MNNQLMTFSSEELNFSMSGILYEGKTAFDAVELAKSLGYTNPAKALKDHCKALIKLDYNESLELGFGEKPRGTQLAARLICSGLSCAASFHLLNVYRTGFARMYSHPS